MLNQLVAEWIRPNSQIGKDSGGSMNSDLQLLLSFAVTMLGAVLFIAAFFEAGEFELELEEIELEKDTEKSSSQSFSDL